MYRGRSALAPAGRGAAGTEQWQGERVQMRTPMIVVIVDHYVKPGLMEAAERRVNANGALAADAPGFRFRYTLIGRDNPLKLTGVTGWDSEETYAAHVETRQAHQHGPAFA